MRRFVRWKSRRAGRRFTAPFLVLFVVTLYQEWLVHELNSLSWPKFGGKGKQRLRLLLVGDPQLIGYQDEVDFVGPFSRWDSDRYVSTTFARAFYHFKPDMVIYLGDLIDEGSKASDGEFEQTVQRFRSVFRAAKDIPAIYVAGDNDIGGEGEPVWKERRERFKKAFNSSTASLTSPPFNLVTFIQANAFDGSYAVISQTGAGIGAHNVLLSHLPILANRFYRARQIFDQIRPSLVISGHDHYATFVHKMHVDSDKLSIIKLNQSSKVQKLQLSKSASLELQVPTCSYRMGVPNMGYGVAILEQNDDGTVSVEFAILWLPGRYPQLYFYLFLFAAFMCYYLIAIPLCLICRF